MKESRMNEIIKEHVGNYLNCISMELESSHASLFNDFGFPIFGENSSESHELTYFQSYLESYTRKMINGILKDVLDEETGEDFHWPEQEYAGIYNGYTNSECERKFGFEFINRDIKEGYRYSFFYDDEIEQLLSKGNVNSIVLVEWKKKDELLSYHYDDERVKVMNLWNLFQELFFDLDKDEIEMMHDLFVGRIANAVDQATQMISLTALPGFTSSYRFKTRSLIMNDMREDVQRLTHFSIEDVNYKANEERSQKLIDEYDLARLFLEKGFECAFVGSSDFAKSYLTAEYLFRFFKKNPMFDYTPIVSGYLKSIEQLLHVLYNCYLSAKSVFVDLSDYTLSGYITDLQKEKLFRKELVPLKSTIIGCLHSFRKECRNKLFHKDYFDSWTRVEIIRRNTLFLYVVLLGAIDQNLISDPLVLGILDTEYDRLFCLLDERKDSFFSFELDGREYLGMMKEPRREGMKFDENGLITNRIYFTKHDYGQDEVVELSRAHLPSIIWVSDAFGGKAGGKGRKIWPVE